MIFDVIVRQGYNDKGKQVINVSRIHDAGLNAYLRLVQEKGGYIISVIPLFRVKRQENVENVMVYGETTISQKKLDEVREQVEEHGG